MRCALELSLNEDQKWQTRAAIRVRCQKRGGHKPAHTPWSRGQGYRKGGAHLQWGHLHHGLRSEVERMIGSLLDVRERSSGSGMVATTQACIKSAKNMSHESVHRDRPQKSRTCVCQPDCCKARTTH